MFFECPLNYLAHDPSLPFPVPLYQPLSCSPWLNSTYLQWILKAYLFSSSQPLYIQFLQPAFLLTSLFYLLFAQLGASLVAQMVKNLPVMQETQFWSLGQDDPLEKGMVIHSSIAWRILLAEEPGRQTIVHGIVKGLFLLL